MPHPPRILPVRRRRHCRGGAADRWRAQPVAMPTETVYGLAADATNAEAVARNLCRQGPPELQSADRPCPRPWRRRETIGVFSADARALGRGALARAADAGGAAARPGADIAALVTAGLPTIALRVPAHPAMQALLAATGRPLAAPSANASRAASARRVPRMSPPASGERIPLIVDGGPCERGHRIDHRRRDRRPAAPAAAGPDRGRCRGSVVTDAIEAPGQLASHYAPVQAAAARRANGASDGEYLIGFGDVAGDVSLSAIGQSDRSGGTAVRPASPGRRSRRTRESPSRRSRARPRPPRSRAAAPRDIVVMASDAAPERLRLPRPLTPAPAKLLRKLAASLGGMTARQ